MKPLARLTSAVMVIPGVLKLAFDDRYEGVVDLRPLLAKGKVFAWLQDPANFETVRVEAFGHAVSWTDATGYEIDLSADSLRRDCERQAKIHELMAV